MRYKRANIDSLNLSSETMESIFIHHSDYSIEAVKTNSVFNPEVWSKTFSKPLAKMINGEWFSPMIEAKIVHTNLGLTLALKTFAITPKRQTVEFAGLHGYNERSEFLLQHLHELKSQLQYTRVTRVDVSLDYLNGIPKKVISNLKKHRYPRKKENSTYWKTKGEKGTNRVMDIITYDKSLHATLDYDVHRLEFRFKSAYLKKLTFRDIEDMYQRMEKTIKRFAGVTVKISSIID